MTVLMPASLAAVRHLRMQGGSLGEKMGSFTGVTMLLSRQRDFFACRAAGSLILEILCLKKIVSRTSINLGKCSKSLLSVREHHRMQGNCRLVVLSSILFTDNSKDRRIKSVVDEG